MCLVQRNFQRAGDDLHRAGEAGRRRQDEGQARRRHAAGLGDAANERVGRRAIDLEHEARALGIVAIAELGEKLFLERARPAWSRGQREELALLQAPAGILAAKAGEHRIGGVDADGGRRRGAGIPRGKKDVAEAAEADFGDAAAGLEPAALRDAGIDDHGTRLAARDADTQSRRIGDESVDEWRREAVNARTRREAVSLRHGAPARCQAHERLGGSAARGGGATRLNGSGPGPPPLPHPAPSRGWCRSARRPG